MEEEIEKLVEMVSARVKEKLAAQENRGSQSSCADSCSASKSECTGCGHSASRRPDDTRKIIDFGAARVSSTINIGHVRSDIAPYIDHTLLKPNATKDELAKLCQEALKYEFAAVCVNPSNVRFCKSLLNSSAVKVVAVVGFPFGATSPEAKAFEAKEALRNGADEIDMVMNIGAMKSKDYAVVLDDIQKVVRAAQPHKVKVIIETGMLTQNEKVIACALAKIAGAAFVKTSTGFGPGGATVEDVILMKEVVGEGVEVKASGGIRTVEDAEKMLRAGATRIGASASVAIVTGKKEEGRLKWGGRKSY